MIGKRTSKYITKDGRLNIQQFEKVRKKKRKKLFMKLMRSIYLGEDGIKTDKYFTKGDKA